MAFPSSIGLCLLEKGGWEQVPGIGKEARQGRRQKRVEGERVRFMSETLGYRSCSKTPSTLYKFVEEFFLLQKSCFQKLCGITAAGA